MQPHRPDPEPGEKELHLPVPGTGVRGVLFTLASFVIVVAGLKAARGILVPFLLAVFISILCMVPMNAMIRRGVPRLLAVISVILGLLLVGTGVVVLVGTRVASFTATLPEYESLLTERTSEAFTWLESRGLKVDRQTFRDTLNLERGMDLAAQILTQLSGLLTASFLILLTVVFLLLEGSTFPLKVRAMSSQPDVQLQRMGVAVDKVNRYMAIKATLSLVTGTLAYVVCNSVGVDFPVLWGILAFMFNFVPNIGSILAAIPPICIAWVELGTLRALLTAFLYLVLNVSVSNLIEPRFMGRGLGLSPLIVFLSLVFWGWVLGPVGMLLSVPITMVLKLAFDASRDMRGVGLLLGPGSRQALGKLVGDEDES